MTFPKILDKFRKSAFSERNKGDRFERLMQAYLQTDRLFADRFKKVWLWNEFPFRNDFSGKDTGIDLVAQTHEGDYWAIQCKCFQEDTRIDKPAVDTFLATSSKRFNDENFKSTSFVHRLWIDTTKKGFGYEAQKTMHNQTPPVSRIGLYDLQNAPVDWEILEKGISGEEARPDKKIIREHQKLALNNAHEYFKTANRGKLIMACGTGKTFTSLKIAENETNGKGLVLFLVPSIALLGQTLREWTSEADEKIHAICICSDAEVSQKKTKFEDTDGFSVEDLALPASTNVNDILKQFKSLAPKEKGAGLTVVFSTYQSIEVISKVQKELAKLPPGGGIEGGFIFDLIICDEAHRTTGVSVKVEKGGYDESAFVRVHDNNFIQAHRRMYMTATPRLYSDDVKDKAKETDTLLCSMDDPAIYGEEIYRIGFGEAVERNLLSDYKVLVLTMNENQVPLALQKAIANDEHEIDTDDASRLIGCINALSKRMLIDADLLKKSDPEPMRRAVAFCQTIEKSKKITNAFNSIKDTYYESLGNDEREEVVNVNSDHVDGTMGASTRDQKLAWLKATPDDSRECRILTNVRCLSEGVDVPTLDAVLFLSARNSQVDVVQSVGRVMRKAPGKKYGYIIIPVVIPSDVSAEHALSDNKRFAVVWTVLNALRAHDDRFNATINQIELNKKKPKQILVGGVPYSERDDDGHTDQANDDGSGASYAAQAVANQLAIQFEELQSVIYAKMVLKVGNKRYWEQWAADVAKIAERHIERINELIQQEGKHQQAFEQFLGGLRKNINPSVTQQEAVEMLAQHLITQPVFEALFENYSFVKNNPISQAMQGMLDLLEEHAPEEDLETLDRFYKSVRQRAEGLDNAEAKQRIIIELYDKFFKTAFPMVVEKLGIVYTPVEVVDFIVQSVGAVLQKEFRRSLSDENIHILDPFTGTGTFMTRLLQSGLIAPEDLERKYKHELHANEIVLLAYYIASINIENVYHDLVAPSPSERAGGEAVAYTPFNGICLTDTFQLGETDASEKLFSNMFPQNSERVEAQRKAPLRVIIGNPPYSVGQKSANDNAQNQSYTKLDNRIAKTYAAETDATNKNSLYDSYIKAFRWSSDRLDKENGGIIAFVSNGAWIDGNSTEGFRKSLEKEFSAIYVFNLRGNARTQGELRRKEAGNVFGGGSRTPISITILVRNPQDSKSEATIYYHDIGDYLNREEKLTILKKFGSIVNSEMQLKILSPNDHGDWISQRNDLFETFIPMGDKDDKRNINTFFLSQYSNGVKTNRDAWVYNFSNRKLATNSKQTIDCYNEQAISYNDERISNQNLIVEDFIDADPKKISWSRALRNDIARNKRYIFDADKIRLGIYRPFSKQHIYFSRDIINDPAKIPILFPKSDTNNILICVPGVGVTKDFSTIITDTLPDLELIGKSQCFPLYYYEKVERQQLGLFDVASDGDYVRRDGVSDFILERARAAYGHRVVKEDVFYYVYGLLHNPQYRERYAADLKKMLPRIPLVDEPKDFWAFSKAGRELAELHINYETVAPYPHVLVVGDSVETLHATSNYLIEKMRFPKKDQKDTIIYNSHITISNIPAEAYEYIVNGKSAIEWILERYQITTHKESGIRNDPNDWAIEVGNPRYILDLLLSVINVSVKSVEIVKGLPELGV